MDMIGDPDLLPARVWADEGRAARTEKSHPRRGRGLDPRKLRLALLGAWAAVIAAAPLAPALAQSDQNLCNGVEFDIKRPLVVSKVIAPSRVYFVKGFDAKAACPSDAAACRMASYLVPGDLALTGRTLDGFVCVSYQSPLSGVQDWTKRWLPATALAPVPPMRAPTTSDWIGRWVHPGGEISIAPNNTGRLTITGSQTYPALLSVHTGDLAAEAMPSNGMIAFADDGSVPFDKAEEGQCLVRIQRVGAWLAVEDNERCGGVMVTFTGLYRRR